MKSVRFAILAMLVGSLVTFEVSAQFGKTKGKNKGAMAGPTTILTDPLVPADLLAKLKITGEQKIEVDSLLKEYNNKLKDIASKPADPDVTPAKGVKGKGKGGSPAASPMVAAAYDLHEKYEDMFEKLLTDPQKKILEDYRAKQGEALLNPGKK